MKKFLCCSKSKPKTKNEVEENHKKKMEILDTYPLEKMLTTQMSLNNKEWSELTQAERLKFSNGLNGWSSKLYIENLEPNFIEIQKELSFDIIEVIYENEKEFKAKGMLKQNGNPIFIQGFFIEKCNSSDISSDLGMNNQLMESIKNQDDLSIVPKMLFLGTQELSGKFDTCQNTYVKIIEGGPITLGKLTSIRRNRNLSFTSPELAKILLPIAKFLVHLEKLNVYFEYLSPDMFFIGPKYNQIYIHDWKAAFSCTESHKKCDKFLTNYDKKYFAPEIKRGEPYKPSAANSYYFGVLIAYLTECLSFDYNNLHVHCLKIVKQYPAFGSQINNLLSNDPRKRPKIMSLISRLKEEASKLDEINERESCKIAQYHIFKEDGEKEQFLEKMISLGMKLENYSKVQACMSILENSKKLSPSQTLIKCSLLRNLKKFEEAEKFLVDVAETFKTLDSNEKNSIHYFIDYYFEFAALKYDQNNFPFAFAILEKALISCQNEPEKSREKYPMVLLILGIISERLGKFEDSYQYYCKSYESFIKLQGDDHPASLSLLHLIGKSLIKIGKINEAIEKLNLCFGKKALLYSNTHEEMVYLNILLGNAYTFKGDFRKAEEYFKKAIADSKKQDSMTTIFALSNLANIDAYTGSFETSIEYGKKCKELLLQKNNNVETNELADVLNNIGCCYMELGMLDEAESNFKDCLRIVREQNGEESTKVFPSIYNFGRLFHQMKDFEKAKICYENSLKLLADNITNFGNFEYLWHKISIQDNYALLLAEVGDIITGLDIVNDSIELRAKINNFGLYKSKMIKAQILYRGGNLKEAKDYLVNIVENNVGENFEILYVSNNLANILIELKELPQASKIIENALKSCDQSFKLGNSRIKATLLNTKAILLSQQEKNEEAVRYIKESIEMKTKLNSQSHNEEESLQISNYNMKVIESRIMKQPLSNELRSEYTEKLVQSLIVSN